MKNLYKINHFQIEVQNPNKEKIKIPLAVLKAGETSCLRPCVEFRDTSIELRLIKGSGPVHVMGRHIFYELEQMEHRNIIERMSAYDDDEEEEEQRPQANGNSKRKK